MNIKSLIVSNKQLELDMKLAPYDLWATKVHALMLLKQNLIPINAGRNIVKALTEIEKECRAGKFVIDQKKGLHLTIEAKVVEKIDNDGYYMHTARSRNDQVATAELLYLREKVLNLFDILLKLQKVFLSLASVHIATVMPGYTHMQPAKPTTFASWCLSYFNMISRCIDALQYILIQFDQCPLGAVESYGTSWKIDRQYSAKLLGFAKVWEVPQDAISSRGMVQLAYLGVLKDIAISVSKIVSDLLLFNTFEYGYISLSQKQARQMDPVTGSSIMPQKKNPDALELIRSFSYQVIGYENIVANMLAGLPMGYNRDSRETKEYIELGFEKTASSLIPLAKTLKNLRVKKEQMQKAVLKNYSLATDLADYIAQKTGLAYREIYRVVGGIVKKKIKENKLLTDISLDELAKAAELEGLELRTAVIELKEALDPAKALNKRAHIGGSSSKVMKKMIQKRKKLLQGKKKWLDARRKTIELAKKQTQNEEKET